MPLFHYEKKTQVLLYAEDEYEADMKGGRYLTEEEEHCGGEYRLIAVPDEKALSRLGWDKDACIYGEKDFTEELSYLEGKDPTAEDLLRAEEKLKKQKAEEVKRRRAEAVKTLQTLGLPIPSADDPSALRDAMANVEAMREALQALLSPNAD